MKLTMSITIFLILLNLCRFGEAYGILMPFLTIFLLYGGSQFYWWMKPGETTDLQVTDKLSFIT